MEIAVRYKRFKEMREFIWYLKLMYSAKKYMKENEQCRTEYYWYKYLVNCMIKSFINRLKPRFLHKNELPF